MARLRLSPGLLLWAAAALLLFPLRWLLAWAAAVCIHELGHLIMLRLLHIPVHSLRVSGSGTRLQTAFSSRWQELLCAAAGPAAGLCMLPWIHLLPRVTLCSVFLALYNLLPVYPLDGGRCLRCLVGGRIGSIVQAVALAGLLVLGAYASFFLQLGGLPLILSGVTVIRALGIKIPCKAAFQALQ